MPLADRWALSFITDTGGGDSGLTWQAGLTFDKLIILGLYVGVAWLVFSELKLLP